MPLYPQVSVSVDFFLPRRVTEQEQPQLSESGGRMNKQLGYCKKALRKAELWSLKLNDKVARLAVHN